MTRDTPAVDTPRLRDITGTEEPPPAPPAPTPPGGLAAVLVLTGAIVLVLVLRRWMGQRAARPGPSQRALRTLDELERQGRTAPDGDRDRATRLLAVLRGYLEARFGLPATCRTSEEVLAGLPPTLATRGDLLVWVERILSLCDGAAFGRKPLSSDEWREACDLFRDVVREAEDASAHGAAPELPVGRLGHTGEAAEERGPAEGGPVG